MKIDETFFPKAVQSLSIKEVLEYLEADLQKNIDLDLNQSINDIGGLDSIDTKAISFLANKKYLPALRNTKVGYCFITDDDKSQLSLNTQAVIVPDPYLAIAKLATKFYLNPKYSSNDVNIDCDNAPFSQGGYIASSAKVSKQAKLGKNVQIGENVIINKGAIIKDGAIILHNCVVGSNVQIGQNSILGEGSVIKYSILGSGCLLDPGVKIGQDGFGFVFDKKNNSYFSMPHLGLVIIGNNVEIGANTTIDRGSLNNTVIKDGVRIDNQVQIAHNVNIQDLTVIAAHSGIAGSTTIGSGCQIGGLVGITGHIAIGNGATIAGKSGVIGNIGAGEKVGGYPAVNLRDWHKINATLLRQVRK